MEVITRNENNLLNRVEIEFRIKHTQQATPSRNEIMDMVLKTEPGSKKELVILKRINTRFGQALTTGFAHVYENLEYLKSTEMKYMLERHASFNESSESETDVDSKESGGE
ncbi:MAG: hypothetical protein CMB56_003175 [Methanobacteriota archaeon]|mgnify:CR=1 FL=1|nr:MAG: hypothetical protein CMB56_003175 [Euryarchaeota archaeon]|tara:strand:+ start:9005 stop:9337 length:333 start_codon:yes stop_codon:yes gene_type:complete